MWIHMKKLRQLGRRQFEIYKDIQGRANDFACSAQLQVHAKRVLASRSLEIRTAFRLARLSKDGENIDGAVHMLLDIFKGSTRECVKMAVTCALLCQARRKGTEDAFRAILKSGCRNHEKIASIVNGY